MGRIRLAVVIAVAVAALAGAGPGSSLTVDTVSDITTLSALGWSADIPLDQTIARYIDWIRPFKGTRGYLDAAEAAMRSQNVLREAK